MTESGAGDRYAMDSYGWLLGRCQRINSLHAAIAVLRSLRPDLPALSYADIRPLLIEGGPAGRRTLPAASKQRVVDELGQIAQQASELRATLANIHPSTADLFRNLDEVRRTLRTLEIAGGIEVPEPLPDLKKMVPAPQRLAIAAAHVFIAATCLPPTIVNKERQPAHGDFLEFLAAVFAARGVTASLENCAKVAISAINAKKRRRSPQ